MAVWVSYVKANNFPAIASATPYAHVDSFRKAVRTEARTNKVWARYKTSFTSGDAELEVDVEAVPGVRPLFPDGALKS